MQKEDLYKIGEFSKLCRLTVKTLRYYEKTGLLLPSYTDNETGYRYYQTSQLIDIQRIIMCRQLGMTIKEIVTSKDFSNSLLKRKNEIIKSIEEANHQLLLINNIINVKEKIMAYQAIVKKIPSHIVYYREGMIKSYNDIVNFILEAGKECRDNNPGIKCLDPDYCYVSYFNHSYVDHDIKLCYAQAVNKMGKESTNIKFRVDEETDAICVLHKGSYSKLGEAYTFGLLYVKENNYLITGDLKERYIDGMWNKDNEDDWLTEIEIPVVRK